MTIGLIDLSKKELLVNRLANTIQHTVSIDIFEKIYYKNEVFSFLGRVDMFFEDPSREELRFIKMEASLIYWDLVFYMMECGMDVYADDHGLMEDFISETSSRDKSPEKQIEFVFNQVANIFYFFATLQISSVSIRGRTMHRIYRVC